MQGIYNADSTAPVYKSDKPLPKNNDNRKEVSNKTNSDVAKYTAAGVTALAVIGLATFAILSRKKTNSNIKQNGSLIERIHELTSQKSDLTEKISKLKTDIRSEYLKKKSSAREEVGVGYNNFQHVVANGNESALKSAYDEITRYEVDMAELSQRTRDKFKGNLVKNTNGKQVYQGGLLDDPVWKEVRKLRRLYVKNSSNNCYVVAGRDCTLKLGLANEVIKSKLTGQPIIFHGKELPIDDAIKMIKDPNYDSDAIRKYLRDNKLSYFKNATEAPDVRSSPFYVSYFSKNADSVIKNYKRIPEIKARIAGVDELKAKYHDISVALAKETRESENVKQLKKLLAQLKSVSDELNSLQA